MTNDDLARKINMPSSIRTRYNATVTVLIFHNWIMATLGCGDDRYAPMEITEIGAK